MNRSGSRLIAAVCLLLLNSALVRAAEPQLAHMVFFTLQKDTPDNRERLINACRKYLTGHKGTVYFSAGAIADEVQREVNDRDFDVALHLVFRNQAAHDAYQEHPRHLEFVEKHQQLWSQVRVFDSFVTAEKPKQDQPKQEKLKQAQPSAKKPSAKKPSAKEPSAKEPSAKKPSAKKPIQKKRKREASAAESKQEAVAVQRWPLPDPASGFAGLIRGKVVRKIEGDLVVKVSKVTQEWEHSRAVDRQALVGKRVRVRPVATDGPAGHNLVRFVELVEVGEELTLDVAHRSGEDLLLLELLEDQRARIQ